VLSRVIVGIMWYYILKIGLPTIFQLLGLQGLSNVEWIGTQWSLYSIILVSTWLYMGTALIIYVTSLESISVELFEAAFIDGASRLKSFWYIAVPLIVPAFLVNFILSIILGFQQFDQILSMTRGGPGNATNTLTYSIYNKAYLSIDGGYATAEAYVLFLIVMVIALLIIRFFRTKEVEA
jgi:ABC-type sugar transport system permease subunit